MDSVKKGSLFSDRVIQILLLAIGLVIIGALLTGVFAVLGGVVSFEKTPQTINDLDVSEARRNISVNGTAQDYGDLVMRLADQGKMTDARDVLQQARDAKLDVLRSQALDYADAYLLMKENKVDEAIAQYEQVMSRLMEAYEQELSIEGENTNWARAYGVPANYYASALALSEIYADRGEADKELEYLSIFIEGYPQDGSALIRRGQIELEEGDTKAAKKDFEAGLKFLPDDEEGLAGLAQLKGK
ncbi:MAG: hypothetical protein LBJ07_04270 [Actinomycetes bacterium]|jgi:tetratricopeptide (TPR) repeat protein|nr:hypothetical protein [Actinomycetes bacterium]